MTPSFKAYVAEHNHAAVRLSCILCAVLLPAGLVLDLLTHPDRAGEFLVLRVVAGFLALVLLGLSRLQWMRRYSSLLIVALILTCAGAIEVMIVRLGGAKSSPYYAGLNLFTLGIGLLFVWSGRQTLWVCLLILSMWLLPALLENSPLGGDFFNNLYFLVLTGIIAVAANATRYNLARREYEARTALAQATSELKASLSRIREMDRLKSQFFANISHELRTPLTLIMAPIQDLLHKDQPQEVTRSTLQVVLRNTMRLHRLIDGLFDLARLEAGRLRLRISPLDVKALTEEVAAAFAPAAEAMSLKLGVQVDGAADWSILGDADKLEVVLTNLLGNAVKFTEKGGSITVMLRRPGEHVEIKVIDDGPGIPEADQPYIFERFRRVESPGRKQGGAGIGLALVKELVELHGGTVRVTSAPGQGACFTVLLPVRAQIPGEMVQPLLKASKADPVDNPALLHINDSLDLKRHIAQSKEATGARPLRTEEVEVDPATLRARILIAEDNADLRRFLYDLLTPYYQVELVADGRAAKEVLRERVPDLLLMDVMMPHLSGVDLCKEIKASARTRGLPVILLTARGGIEETLEGFAHGADDYLVKPFNPRELLMRIAVQLKLRRLSAQVANSARLAAIGTLAAGVAHEIKNPLNAINTGAAALRRRVSASSSLQTEMIDIIEECVARIADISAALTDHARPADGEGVSLLNLRSGIESTLRLLGERLRGTNITVVRDYKTDRLIQGRPRQLNQVFLNLLDNAILASQPGGEIHVSVEDLREGWVVVRVRDEGPGIPREDLPRIFDPFFTTRPAGQGTGLGLYLSHQIVEAHGGLLRVTSEPGAGAEFHVELPVRLAQSQVQGAAA